jgi:fermentation-respiration switch protein FrsA (DUF1100 family)
MKKHGEIDRSVNAQVGPDVSRRKVLQMTGLGVAALGVTAIVDTPASALITLAWDETFPKSAKVEGITDPVTRMYFDYYRTPRGFHERSPNSSGAWTATAPMSFMNLPLLTYVAEISPRPLLLIAGGKAHSRYFSEDAYQAASQPKELMIEAAQTARVNETTHERT